MKILASGHQRENNNFFVSPWLTKVGQDCYGFSTATLWASLKKVYITISANKCKTKTKFDSFGHLHFNCLKPFPCIHFEFLMISRLNLLFFKKLSLLLRLLSVNTLVLIFFNKNVLSFLLPEKTQKEGITTCTLATIS